MLPDGPGMTFHGPMSVGQPRGGRTMAAGLPASLDRSILPAISQVEPMGFVGFEDLPALSAGAKRRLVHVGRVAVNGPGSNGAGNRFSQGVGGCAWGPRVRGSTGGLPGSAVFCGASAKFCLKPLPQHGRSAC